MPASPTSSKAEYVFPGGKCTNTFIKHINVCTWTATQINTDSTNGLILLPSPADQNDSPSMANIYIYTQYGCLRPPVAGLRHSVYPVAALGSLDPRILSFPGYWHLDIERPSKAAAPLHLQMSTVVLMIC